MLPTTALILTQPACPSTGYGRVFTTAPFRFRVDHVQLSKVAWGLLLARYANTETVSFGHVEIPPPPVAKMAAPHTTTGCSMHLAAGTRLSALVDEAPYPETGCAFYHEWSVAKGEPVQLNTALTTYGSTGLLEGPEAGRTVTSVNANHFSIDTLAADAQATVVVDCQVADDHLTVNLTFDRRAVAVSTAQRLCYQFSTVMQALAKVKGHPGQTSDMTIADVPWVDATDGPHRMHPVEARDTPGTAHSPGHGPATESETKSSDATVLEEACRIVSLDHALAEEGILSPLSVVTGDTRIVTFTAAPEAECQQLEMKLSRLGLPVAAAPAALLSFETYPHLSREDGRGLRQLAEAYLLVAGEADQLGAQDDEGLWLAVTCADLLRGADFSETRVDDLWENILARPILTLQLRHRIQQRHGALLDVRTILTCEGMAALALTAKEAGQSMSQAPRPQISAPSPALHTTPLTPYQARVWVAAQLSEHADQFYYQATVSLDRSLPLVQIQHVLEQFMGSVDWLSTVPPASLDHDDVVLVDTGMVVAAYRTQSAQLVVRVLQILGPEALFNHIIAELSLALWAEFEGRSHSINPLLLQSTAPTAADQALTVSAPAYWATLLAGVSTDIPLLLDHPRSRVPSFQSTAANLHLSGGLMDSITSLVEPNKGTITGTWVTLIGSYLGRISSGTDPVVDVVLNHELLGDRLYQATSHATFPVRFPTAKDTSDLFSLGTEIDKQLRQSVYHLTSSDRPYTVLSRLPGFPLWHPVRVAIHVHQASTGNPPVVSVTNDYSRTACWHDLVFRVDVTGREPTMAIWFNSDLLEATTIGRLGANLMHYIQVALTSPQPLSTVPLVCPTEERLLLKEFGSNPGKYDPHDSPASVISLVRSSVQRSPDSVALESPTETVTYGQMNAQVDCLARALQTHGILPQDRVAVIVESRPATVVAMLALWLLRAVYVPIDRTLPEQRRRYMVEAAQCTHVLNMTDSDGIWTEAFPGLALLQAEADSNSGPFPYVHQPNDLAYIIFTSGTTGQPKGVMIRHAGLTNLLVAPETRVCPIPGSRVLQVMSAGFDTFMIVSLSPLCTSSTVVFNDGDIPAVLQRVDVTFMNPSLLASFNPKDYPNIKRVISGGEALLPELAARWLPHCQMENTYGPTETTVTSHAVELQAGGAVSIGRPISGCSCYILNPFHQPVPIGVIGEIYIGGLGVSAGYVNRPDLNATQFVRLPFSDGLVYRTGDLGRWLPDGVVECLGRRDDQVKLRGFRVELAEVRGALLNLHGIRDAYVLIHEHNLVAFTYPSCLEGEFVTSALRKVLPHYMVPSYVLGLGHVPRTTNGKVDRRALVELFTTSQRSQQSELSPTAYPDNLGDEALTLASAVQAVLRVWAPNVNLSSSFLKLGGDSISAIQVSARCRQLGYSLSVPDLLEDRTLSDLSTLMQPLESPPDATLQVVDKGAAWSPSRFPLLHCIVADLDRIATDLAELRLAPTDVADLYPMTLTQQGLWTATAKDPAEYVIQFALTVVGDTSTDQIHRALASVVARHAILRTVFLTAFSNAHCTGVQVVTKQPLFGWTEVTEWSELDVDAEGAYLTTNWRRGFRAGEPLLRALVKRGSQGRHRLVVAIHHALMDGWTMGVFLDELRRTIQGDHSLATIPPPQFRDYVRWTLEQRDHWAPEYWRTYLHGVDQPTLLALPHDPCATPAKREHRLTLYADLDRLKTLFQAHGLTIYTVLKAAWAVVLSRYTGREDVVFGSVVSGRALPLAGIEGLFGCLVNTVPCRVRIDPELPVPNQLRRLNNEGRLGIPREHDHLTNITRWVPSDVPVSGLFNTLLVLENVPDWGSGTVDDSVTFTDLTSVRSTEYAMTVIVQAEDGQLISYLNWDLATFAQPYVEALGQHLQATFDQLMGCLREDSRGVSTLSSRRLLSPDEYQAATEDLTRPTAVIDVNTCAHDLFVQQVQHIPNTTAVEYDDPVRGLITWTYQGLLDRAKQVAHYLTAQGVQREEPVGLLMDRLPSAVAAMLGVHLAGAAFVPLDPSLPLDRLRFITGDCGIRRVLCNTNDEAKTKAVCEATGVTIDSLDGLLANTTDQPTTPDMPRIRPADLSHILYTSGTTGQPKGVQLEHRVVANFVQQSREVIAVEGGMRVMQNMALTFDCCLFEVWVTLCNGATLVLRNDLLDTLPKVDVLMATPSVLATLDPTKYPNLRHVITAGEALPRPLAERWSAHCPVTNMYGPTECFVCHTMRYIPGGPVTIGRPVPNTECYILDGELRPVPIGVPGEIYVGGVCVTRGYVNRPDLEAATLLPNPFTGQGYLYRTGDLGRWLLDGTAEYLARRDDQVKIRGHRVEPREIEAVLNQYVAVGSVAVVVSSGKLYAFVSPDTVVLSDLKAHAVAHLPPYMVPRAILPLSELPRNLNGKTDKHRLLELLPSLIDHSPDRAVTAPKNEVQGLLVEVMATVLDLPTSDVDIDDSFLQLGGDSISAIRLSSLCRDRGLQVSIAQIFQHGTPAALARIAAQNDPPSATMEYRPFDLLTIPEDGLAGLKDEVATGLGVEVEAIEDILPVSSLQQGFLISTLKDPTAYMVQMAYDLTGSLDVAKWSQSWSQVVRSHQILRTKFIVPTDQSQHAFLQVVLRDTDFEWTYHDQPRHDIAEVERDHFTSDRKRGFTLSGPLLRFTVYRGPGKRHLFCITFHHALLDAWSESIVMAESLERYHGVEVQRRTQYHDFLRHVSRIDQATMADFWQDYLDGVKLHSAVQFPIPPDSEQPEHGEIRYTLSPSLSSVQSYCREMGLTVNALLRAVWALTLARYLSEHEEVTFGVLVSGRNVAVPGIEGMVGMCINTLPFRTHFPVDGDLQSLLQGINNASGILTEYEQCSLVDIKRWSNHCAGTHLLNSLLVYKTYETTTAAGAKTIDYTPRSGQNFTEYAYTIGFSHQDDALVLEISYQTRYCDPTYAPHLVNFIDHCLASLVSGRADKVGDLMGLPPIEKSLVDQWSIGHTVDFPQKDWLAHQFFTQNLATQPDAIALESATAQFTYADVYRRACAIEAALYSQGARCGDQVALLFTRSPEFIFSYLAILLLGGVCVPMDASNAVDRLAHMVNNLNNPWVVTNSTASERAAEVGVADSRIVYADLALETSTQGQSLRLPFEHVPNSLAYIVFTSGTTGRPKGVQVTHRSLVNFVLAACERFQLPSNCRFLQTLSIAFDSLVLEVFCTFHTGGTLVLQDGELLEDLKRVNCCAMVPSLLAAIDPEIYSNLQHIIMGGESLAPTLAHQWSCTARIHNSYGPTEVTVMCHSHLAALGSPMTVGTTLANVQCHILDDQLRPVPVGITGEIYIAGAGVSKGYWKQPELTDKVFLDNPFGAGRLYRTGDLGCWLAKGEVQVLGRKDFQVKLRGFRIELGEIESTCQAFPGVSSAVALVKDERL
ncbi:hypothetical protein IWQ60_006355, partial [Tieghemiomyces parasiticus]